MNKEIKISNKFLDILPSNWMFKNVQVVLLEK